MKVDIDVKSKKCDFRQCINYESGECMSEENRRDCLEIALAVLCIKEEEAGLERRLQESI